MNLMMSLKSTVQHLSTKPDNSLSAVVSRALDIMRYQSGLEHRISNITDVFSDFLYSEVAGSKTSVKQQSKSMIRENTQ
jgi:hypothetical protein